MSYYRSSSSNLAPPDLLPSVPRVATGDAKSSDDEMMDNLVSPAAIAKPLPMIAGNNKKESATGKRRIVDRPRQLDAQQQNLWMSHLCNVRPLGACARPQTEHGVYCTLHTCTATNVDGSRCGNLVQRPSETRYCTNGWHTETSSFSTVEELISTRQAWLRMEDTEREEAFAEHAEYFLTHFPSAITSTSNTSTSSIKTNNSSDSNPNTENLVRSAKGKERNRSQSVENDRLWAGPHGIDKWWVGEWRKTQSHDGTTTTNTAARTKIGQ